MIPSTAPPFAMTRWVSQTRQNYVSMTPYNYTDTSIHGFQGTHQPAIWMGESGQVVVVPGAGRVRDIFEHRGMKFVHENEVVSASYYSVKMDGIEGGQIFAEQSASEYTSIELPFRIQLNIGHSISRWPSPFHIFRHFRALRSCTRHSRIDNWLC
jgi:putative alpha-1,2-mannosidase